MRRLAWIVWLLASAPSAFAQTPDAGAPPAPPTPPDQPGQPATPTPSPAPGTGPVPGPAPAEPAPAPVPAPGAVTEPAPPPKPSLGRDNTNESRLAAEQICQRHSPECDWFATFSTLEQQSILRGLAARGLEIEPAPWGKTIDKIHVYNENVFAEDNWLSFLNHLHFTTREHRIKEGLTFAEGDTWADEQVAESARKLHDNLYSSVVAMFPVKSKTPGRIDVFVVTRDIWSLRLNTQYTFQQGSLTNLAISISENNFLGERNLVSAAVLMDQASLAVGPLFIDKNLLGKHLDFRIRVDDILTRRAPLAFDPTDGMFHAVPGDPRGLEDNHEFHSEGYDSTVTLSRPLWSLRSEWGWGISWAQRNAVVRAFTGAAPDPVNFPNVDGDPNALYLEPETGLPYEYRIKTWSLNPYAVRQWGTKYKQQLTFGYVLSSQRPELLPNFAGDLGQRMTFSHNVFPHSEVISQPYVDFTMFEPRYRTIRNVGTYELAEDVRMGPDFDISVGQGIGLLGSDHTFTRPGVSIGYTEPWAGDGFVRPSAGATMRLQTGNPHGWSSIDNTANAQVRAATPSTRWGRLIAQVSLDSRWHDTQNAFFTVGSDAGLRGYAVNEFRIKGDGRRVIAALEARTMPAPIWVLRVGAVAFAEAGGLGDSLDDLHLYSDVGLGVRALIPQTSRELFRLDCAFPLQGVPGHSAGVPRIILGFDSYF